MAVINAILIYLAISLSLSILLVIFLTVSYYCRKARLIHEIKRNKKTIQILKRQKEELNAKLESPKTSDS